MFREKIQYAYYCTYESQASEDQMKESDDRMLQSPRRIVIEILEAGVIHEGPRWIVHLLPVLGLSVIVIQYFCV